MSEERTGDVSKSWQEEKIIMATKYSLSYYRGSNIIEPITEMQEGFYSQTEFSGNQIRELQRMIEEDIYGCYLITGMRGVGKTSFMNVALSHTKYGMREKEQVIIRVNAVQMQGAKELFPILVRELLRVVEKFDGRIKNYFKQLQMIDVVSKGTIKKSIREQWTSSHVEENSDSNKEGVNLGIGINSILQLPIQIGTTTNVEREKQLSDAVSAETGYSFEYEVLENPQEWFNDLLDDFEKSNIRLLVVLDEIDKCDSAFLDEIFCYYKDLLLNSKMFWLLVADEQMYQRYLGLKKNVLDTYFIKKIYLPLMTYEETMQYCFQHYCEEKISSVDIIYYLSIGNRRLINIHYLTKNQRGLLKREDIVLLYKARLFKDITSKVQYDFDMEDIRNYKKDVFKVNVKKFIEYIFERNVLSISEAIEFYDNIKGNSYPYAAEIVQYIKEYTGMLGLQIINVDDEKIALYLDNGVRMRDSMNDLMLDYSDGREVHDNNKIGIRELYPFYELGMRPCMNGVGKVRLVKLGNNHPHAYRDAMEHLLIANFFCIQRLIWIKRVREGGCYTDEEYSLLAVIETPSGMKYGYYNEAGSYSSESSYAITDLIEKLKEMEVSYSERRFDKGESFEEIINQIAKELNGY